MPVLTSAATAQGGREGVVRSSDDLIHLELGMPKDGGGAVGKSNPEQLFAAGYASCFDGAFNLIAKKAKKDVESSTTAHVSLEKDPEDDGFKISVKLAVEVKGVSQEEAEDLLQKAHEFCPYSKATRGNIEVDLEITAE
ncbi:organic hydroperoxide resistance protein [Jeotgalibacillus proteolyticus]|uniref:Organic hydroperoxide resistance protein OhrA n=1 Tax=Jeotgalibacillus proteolyticus TaxID=2082395 RepID=A0A2S5GC65_9BACL|nr:organic hydroperoxide resistance protein [Jeotgalibacillus proteolyticus]PPA70586.1 Organic hydroperoxide resistance protein OhrA [Jeotgalibacillus proteolyticus]